MCGRLVTPSEAEIEAFWHIGRHNWRSPFENVRHARFNVAPQQGNPCNHIPVIRADADGTLELTDMQWWLLSFWSKEPRIKYATFNARVESVATSASFRERFKRRRCLIPAHGWYEREPLASRKQPWFLHASDAPLVAFVGLWDCWQRGEETIESCKIIVGDATPSVSQIHNRMPFLISTDRQSTWLNPSLTDPAEVRTRLQPVANDAVAFHAVSKLVGNVATDGRGLIEPVGP